MNNSNQLLLSALQYVGHHWRTLFKRMIPFGILSAFFCLIAFYLYIRGVASLFILHQITKDWQMLMTTPMLTTFLLSIIIGSMGIALWKSTLVVIQPFYYGEKEYIGAKQFAKTIFLHSYKYLPVTILELLLLAMGLPALAFLSASFFFWGLVIFALLVFFIVFNLEYYSFAKSLRGQFFFKKMSIRGEWKRCLLMAFILFVISLLLLSPAIIVDYSLYLTIRDSFFLDGNLQISMPMLWNWVLVNFLLFILYQFLSVHYIFHHSRLLQQRACKI